MIPEIGHFALMLGLCVALVVGVAGIAGGQRNRAEWIAVARAGTGVLWVLVALAFACLTWAFWVNDFSVAYVTEHSNSKLPDVYRVAAVWGGHEGSLLMWLAMLVTWMLAVRVFSRQLPAAMVARVLGVLGLIALGFMLFMLTTSSPFTRLAEIPEDGIDLNPLLQDPGLVFHPPMLYMGYVGMAVPFAFAIAALLNGRLDAAWARWSRPWAIAAWIALSIGITMGSEWAYYVLGWGGWWFWDPVENASFLPWLIDTALIHSLIVTEKRGLFRNWTILLAITAFALSLLGTFLVRSGVLTSVHAFASDPRRGVFILAFLLVVVGGSLTLFAVRAGKVLMPGSMGLVSREFFLLVNNALLATATAAVLLGTLYPLVSEALNTGKLSVGPPYFNTVFVPLMVPLLFAIGVGTAARWKRDEVPALARRLGVPFAVALAVGLLAPFAAARWSALAALGLGLAAWIAATAVQQIARQVRASTGLRSVPAAFWGMHLAHLGVAVCVVGITMVKNYEDERDVRMAVGDTVEVGGYTFRLLGLGQQPGPNYIAEVGEVELSRNGEVLRRLRPEKRQYFSSQMPMTQAAIDTGFTRDVYVSLGDRLDDGPAPAWAVRVYYKPFVDWIWGGGLLMALGGLFAVADRRYRKVRAAATARAALQGAQA